VSKKKKRERKRKRVKVRVPSEFCIEEKRERERGEEKSRKERREEERKGERALLGVWSAGCAPPYQQDILSSNLPLLSSCSDPPWPSHISLLPLILTHVPTAVICIVFPCASEKDIVREREEFEKHPRSIHI